jgi:hypothetical protein
MGEELKMITKKMFRTLVLLAIISCLLSFSFCVNGKPPKYFQTDDRFSAAIIGTWVGVHDQIISENTYLEDGTAKMLLMGPGPEKKVLLAASGSWEIKARQLVKTVKETSDPKNLPLGKVSTYDIVSITDERMTLIAEDGIQISSVRKTQKADEKERRELAEELLTVMKIKNLIERIFDQVKQTTISQLKTMNNSEQSGVETQRITQDLMDLLDKELSWENAKEEYVALYAQEFNEEELRGLLDFHKSPLGHKLLEKMPDLMRKSIQTGQRRTAKIIPRIRKAIDDIQTETERNHKEDSLGEMIFFEVREQL